MKKLFYLIVIISLIMLSCSKKQSMCSSNPAMLEGKWRMVLVKENHSGSTAVKPSNIEGNVDITFDAIDETSGTFYGNTPTNDILQSSYLTGANHILTIQALNMTKVAETSWGKEFVDNILEAEDYSFETDGKLDINTTSKTLIFQRLE